tara:strand:- start:1 stop:372 length:372 start_codon:yes stop_codon:yes gene_type:complete
MAAFDPYTIYNLIDTHGQSTTFNSKSVEGTYDPSTGTNSSGTVVSYTIKGYSYSYKIEEINGTSVTMGDRRMLIKTTDTSGTTIPEPKTNDTFSGVGDTVSVKRVEKLYSGSSVMVYMLQVGE